MAGRRIVIEFLGQDKVSPAAKAVDRSTSRLGTTLGKVGKVAKTGLAVGIGAAGAAIVAGLKDAAEYQRLQAQTGAVLKSTGQAAGVTADDVRGLANEIAGYSDGNDDAIQAGENMLLTFRNIRNETGKGNDIFNQTVKTMADMSFALGTDAKDSALQLGKALNDPIKGVTALQRVGVSFTEKQRDQIKAMVESGHTMQAQKLILGELDKEFGGSAKAAGQTFSGALGRLQDTMGDLLRDAVMPLIPLLTDLAQWLSDKLPVAVGAIQDTFRRFAPVVKAVFDQTVGYVRDHMDQIKATVADVLDIVKTLWDRFGDNIVTVVKTDLRAAFQVIKGAFQIIKGLFEVIDGVLHGDWSKVWQGIKDITKGAVTAIKAVIGAFFTNAKEIFKAAGGVLVDLMKGALGDVVGAVRGLPGSIRDLGSKMLDAGKHLIGQFVKGLKEIGAIGGLADDVFSAITGALHDVINFIIDKLNDAIPDKLEISHAPDINLPNDPIPHLARGTRSFGGGLALVGEEGPELVGLPRGSRVYPAGETAAMLGDFSASRPLVIQVEGKAIAQALLVFKRRNGNVSLGFG